MHINDVRCFIGYEVNVEFTDWNGEVKKQTTHIHEINFIPMYGACLVGDMDDIWLDRVVSISAVE